jgi:hypothetical protein
MVWQIVAKVRGMLRKRVAGTTVTLWTVGNNRTRDGLLQEDDNEKGG